MTRIVALLIIAPLALLLFAVAIERGLAGNGWETLFLLTLGASICGAAWLRNKGF